VILGELGEGSGMGRWQRWDCSLSDEEPQPGKFCAELKLD